MDGSPGAARDGLDGLATRDPFLHGLQRRLDDPAHSGTVVVLAGVSNVGDVHSAYGYTDHVFAVLVPLADADAVQQTLRGLAALWVEPVRVPTAAEVMVTGTFSAAHAAAAAPAGPGAAERLLRDAEIALHRAVASRQPWALYDAGRDVRAGNRLRQVAELREAIADEQFEVHYQPVVDMRTGAVLSLEALVRWRHPERGLVPPDRFIALAEQSGLIDAVTTYVVAAVARQSRARAAAGRPLPCAVNLSVHSLVVPEVSARLVAALAPLRGAVTVEVTESAFADQRAVAVLELLAAAGIPCSIDDFGTGYSCLAALKDLPVTTVKIDRSFTKDIDRDDRDVAFVDAILELAGALGLGVIAEGMETEAAAARLVAAGVVRGQGYLYARPMPADELDARLATRPQPPADREASGAVPDSEPAHAARPDVVVYEGSPSCSPSWSPSSARGWAARATPSSSRPLSTSRRCGRPCRPVSASWPSAADAS